MNCGRQGIILYSGATVRVVGNVITGSRYHAVRSTGGNLSLRDNLIIKNENRGVYLGNKSGRGIISNNIIMDNATGISGFARFKVKIENNLILNSSYAGISMAQSCSLSIKDNIFQANERGWIMSEKGGKGGNTSYRNTFWKNKIDAENFSKTGNSILDDPRFVSVGKGDFSLQAGPAKEHKQGLSNPEIFKKLWKRWQNRKDRNEPFTDQTASQPAESEPTAESDSGDTKEALSRPAKSRSAWPNIIRTYPAAFANDVPASLRKITVTFDRRMKDRTWSWTGGGETFPEIAGDIHYDTGKKTCTLPCKLEPGKVYWIGINSPSHKNFKSAGNVPAKRYVILFATKGPDGSATKIPADMLKRAKKINPKLRPEPGVTKPKPGSISELSRDDGKSAGKRSIAGSGHAVRFDAATADSYLKAVRIYGSRYGTTAAPKEDFYVWLCDENFEVLADFTFPLFEISKRKRQMGKPADRADKTAFNIYSLRRF
jgi:hypothetical protein